MTFLGWRIGAIESEHRGSCWVAWTRPVRCGTSHPTRPPSDADHNELGSSRAKRSQTIVAAFLIAALLPRNARASASGLDNIPTADTAPHLTLVLQEYSTVGAERKPDHTAGFKFGIDPWETNQWRNRFVWGLDGHLAPGDAGPASFNVKYATQPRSNWPALGLGVANLAVTSDDRDRAGQPFSYAVVTHDFGLLRLHGGYGLQARNNAGFAGVDRTFKLFNRDFTLRADALQTQNESQWLASVGGMYVFCKYFALETWGNLPVERGEPSVTIKLDFIWAF